MRGRISTLVPASTGLRSLLFGACPELLTKGSKWQLGFGQDDMLVAAKPNFKFWILNFQFTHLIQHRHQINGFQFAIVLYNVVGFEVEFFALLQLLFHKIFNGGFVFAGQ
mgnify:CR=1 FL=1